LKSKDISASFANENTAIVNKLTSRALLLGAPECCFDSGFEDYPDISLEGNRFGGHQVDGRAAWEIAYKRNK
jgi:hypothetical protein